MTQQKGFNAKVAIDTEASYGTAPGTKKGKVLPFNSCSLKSERNLSAPETITGSRHPVEPFQGNISVAGDIVAPVDGIAFGYWLAAMFGQPTTTGTTTYTHVFKPGDSQPSLHIEKQFEDLTKYALYKGCKISSFSIEFGGDGELTASMGVAGASETISGTIYDSSQTTKSLSRFNSFQATVKEGGSTIATVTRVDFAVDFGLDTGVYTIGDDGVLGAMPEGIMKVSGNLQALFDGTTLLDKAIDGTESSLEIILDNSSQTLTFKIPELKYGRNTPALDGPQGVLVDLPFEGFYGNSSEASVIQATLVNAQASYAA